MSTKLKLRDEEQNFWYHSYALFCQKKCIRIDYAVMIGYCDKNTWTFIRCGKINPWNFAQHWLQLLLFTTVNVIESHGRVPPGIETEMGCSFSLLKDF